MKSWVADVIMYYKKMGKSTRRALKLFNRGGEEVMNNFKENLKKHWKNLLIICAVVVCALGALAGIIISSRNKTEVTGTGYTVEVRGEDGQPVDEVYVALCDAEGNELTWLPYVSNITGEVKYTQDIKEGYYVKVVGVPLGYKLDESVKYSFNESGVAKIVLGEDDSVYVAKIGDNKFLSFSSAVGTANGSNDDVTIELLSDITINTANLNNPYGKSITINGNGHKVTTAGGNNVFVINQKEGVIAFENLKIKHTNTGAVVQANGLVTVNMTDVDIDASDGTAYNYALINTLAIDGTTTLNLTRVNAKMSVGSPAKANEAGIIRTGNTGGTKEVNINLVDCKLDTTEASGRQCIVVMKNTVATINATNSTFKSGDTYAIWAREQSKAQTLTMNNCTATATGEKSAKSPVEGYYAQIGNTYYLPLTAATKVANESNSNITLKLFKDITIKTCDINNKKGKLVTVDGGGRTVTTSGGNNAFVVGNNVMFKNMTINHKNTGSAIHITTAGNVSAQDVTIKATEGKTYSYSLINALATGQTKTTIDLTRVNVVWAVESKGDANASVIRTGNPSTKDSSGKVVTDNSKIVDIKLTDCNFDTTKATGRTGITVTADSTTTVNLKNTTIKTMDTFAIRSNKQTIIWENADTTLTSLTQTYVDYPVEYYLAKIGEKFYTLEEAAKVASAAKSNTQINLLANYTLKSIELNNTAGKQITLNGNGKTITTSGSSNAFLVANKVAFKDMTIKHKETGSAIQVTNVGTFDVSNVTIDATEGKAYDWALVNMPLTDDGATEKAAAGEVITLNMTNVKATMSVAGRGKGDNAIIRTGNADEKNVNINLTNCDFNTEKATGRSGILVKEKTNATINLTNTSMKTLDAPAVWLKDKDHHQTMTMNGCTFDSVSAECKAQPIKGYDAQVGNVAHKAITKAIAGVEAGGTVELLQNVSAGWMTVSKACTIDGNGYKITTTVGDATDKLAFNLTKDAIEVTIKDMDIVHKRRGMVVAANIPTTLTMENVDIDATQAPVSTEYALFNLLGENGTTNLVMKDVTIDMDATEAGKDSNGAIIRTGNANEKTVNITLTNCKLDAAGAVDRYGIVVMNKTNANISLENTKIKTKNVPAIKANEGSDGQATLPASADLICGKKSEEHTGYTVQLGDTWYVKYDNALWDAVKNATEDVTISLTTDTTLNLNGLKNNNGKKITINTAGSRLETTGTKDASVTINSEAVVAMSSKSVYVDLNSVADEVKNATENVSVDVKEDWAVNVSKLANANGKAVTVNSNDNTITATGTLPENVTITSKATCATGSTTYYATFTNALKFAREAADAAVLKLYDNVSLSSNVVISNNNGKSLTIDGNNKQYTITTKVTNTLCVEHNGTVTLKDLKLKHEAKQGTVMVKETSELNLQNVDIDAKNIPSYQYGLINLFGKDGTPTNMTLNMTGVTVNMDGTTTSGSDNAIVRTGNGGANGTKNVTINMTDCSLDTGSATNLNGIRIQSTTTADVTLTNTNISTKNVAPIYNGSTTSTVDRTGGTFTCTNSTGSVKVGNNFYATFAEAVTAANAATAATTIELYGDITDANMWKDATASTLYVSLNNASKKKITLDGNWCSLSINNTKAQNALRVYTEVEFKEMLMNYFGKESLLKTYTNAVNLKFTNVDIVAKNTTTTENYLAYGIIYLDTKPGTNNFKVENTNITVEDGYNRLIGKTVAVIRVNQSGTGDKTLNIEMKNSSFDATNSKGRMGIFICRKVDANITLIDSNIIVDNTNWSAAEGAAVYACTDAGDDRNLTLRGNTSIQTKTVGNTILSGVDAVSTFDRPEPDRKPEQYDPAHDKWDIQIEQPTNAVAAVSEEDEQPATKTLTIEVPTGLYDELVKLIKQFGETLGWNTGL